MVNGQRGGRLGGTPVSTPTGLGQLGVARVVLGLGLGAVPLAEPPTQVDRLAAGAAKRELRPVAPLPWHCSPTDRAVHLYHRTLRSRTWAIFPRMYSSSPSCPPRRFRPNRHSCHSRTWRLSFPGPPSPPACRSRCGSRSRRSPSP